MKKLLIFGCTAIIAIGICGIVLFAVFAVTDTDTPAKVGSVDAPTSEVVQLDPTPTPLQLPPTSTPVPPPPTDTPAPGLACRGEVCIKQVFLSFYDADLMVQFDLVDTEGQVQINAAPQFDDTITFGLFKDDDDTYLFGGEASPDAYACYAGNDVSWSDGNLAAFCGIALTVTTLQVRPETGDPIRVEVIEYNFAGVAPMP